MAIVLEQKNALLISGSQVSRILIDAQISTDLQDLLSSGQEQRAEQLLSVVNSSNKFLHRCSYELGKSFAGSSESARPVLNRLYELSGIGKYDLEALASLQGELNEAVWRELHGRHSEARRVRVAEWTMHPEILLAQMLGWRELMRSKDATLIEWRENAVEETLEALYHFHGIRILMATCKTGKVVMLPVPDTIRTCEEAQMWLIGDTVRELALPRFFSRGRS